MKKIIDYAVVQFQYAEDLKKFVIQSIENWYEPLWGASYGVRDENVTVFVQAMVKYEDSDEAQWQSERIEVIKWLNKEKEMLTAMIPEATKQNWIGAVMTLRERLSAIDKYIGRLLEPVCIDWSAMWSATPNIAETLWDVKP